ncbi:MAG: PaaI family thioesterase [Spirochaetota bacterium]
MSSSPDRPSQDQLLRYFTLDRYAALTGIRLTEVSDGRARAELEVSDRHLNSLRTAQGGVLFTLADLAFAAASNSYGTVAVSISSNISFFRAVTSGTLVAEAREISRQRRVASYEVRVTDLEGDLVAHFTGMVYRKEQPLELD